MSVALGSLSELLHEVGTKRAKGLGFTAPKKLAAAEKRLSSLAEADLREPTPSRRERARLAWADWKQGRGEMPSPVLLRTLCWEPDEVSDDAFRYCLRAIRPLRGRTIQALLPTYLRLWRDRSNSEPYLEDALREDLRKLMKARGVVAKWRDHASQLLGPNAAREFVNDALNRRATVCSKLGELSLATDTHFARSAAAKLLEVATEQNPANLSLDWLLDELLPQDARIAGEAGWGPALRNLILNESLTADESIRERIMDFALRDLELGDPRVSDVPWHPVGGDATREVIHWRSSEDLRFFFDLVMKGKSDYQGRHRFWQKYVDGVTRSLIVLSRDDEYRLRRKLRELESRGRRFAILSGSNMTSAFVMQFGRTVVVEFSEAGNACYVYQEPKGKDPVPWHANEVDIRVLKDRQRAKDWLRHVKGWEYTFSQTLAKRGVRTVSSRKVR